MTISPPRAGYVTALALALMTAAACGKDEAACSGWQAIEPPPQPQALNGIAFGHGQFVAVGDAGRLLTSADGERWTLRDSGTGLALRAVASTQKGFVAVGDLGTILTSVDGAHWLRQEPVTIGDLRGVASAGGRIVVVGSIPRPSSPFPDDEDVILTSLDGATWTRASIYLPLRFLGIRLHAVTASPTRFVAVGTHFRKPVTFGAILSSEDGLAWTRRDDSAFPALSGVAANRVRFVGVGADTFAGFPSPPLVVESTDGAVWTQVAKGSPGGRLNAATWTGTRFVAVGAPPDRAGAGPPGDATVLVSGSGFDWTLEESHSQQDLLGVAAGGSAEVAVGSGGAILRNVCR